MLFVSILVHKASTKINSISRFPVDGERYQTMVLALVEYNEFLKNVKNTKITQYASLYKPFVRCLAHRRSINHLKFLFPKINK